MSMAENENEDSVAATSQSKSASSLSSIALIQIKVTESQWQDFSLGKWILRLELFVVIIMYKYRSISMYTRQEDRESTQ